MSNQFNQFRSKTDSVFADKLSIIRKGWT